MTGRTAEQSRKKSLALSKGNQSIPQGEDGVANFDRQTSVRAVREAAAHLGGSFAVSHESSSRDTLKALLCRLVLPRRGRTETWMLQSTKKVGRASYRCCRGGLHRLNI